MRSYALLATVLAGALLSVLGAEGGKAFARYQEIVQSETDAVVVQRRIRQYLVSLGKDDFMEVVRGIAQEAGYDRDDSDIVLGMVVFAKCYRDGAGKDEPLLQSMNQLSDATLPRSWKIGLLDVLKPQSRRDLTEEEVEGVISALSKAGQSKDGSGILRDFCLRRLGGLLSTQRRLITQRAPDLKDALDKCDRAALPQRDDADVRRAGTLIDAVRDYIATVQKAADEAKDENTKVTLRKRLEEWQPVPAAAPK